MMDKYKDLGVEAKLKENREVLLYFGERATKLEEERLEDKEAIRGLQGRIDQTDDQLDRAVKLGQELEERFDDLEERLNGRVTKIERRASDLERKLNEKADEMEYTDLRGRVVDLEDG